MVPALSHQLIVGASTDNLEQVREFILAAAAELEVRDEVVEDLQLAVDEAVTNIILHGYGDSAGDIEVRMSRENTKVIVAIRDDAPAFDILGVDQPDLSVSPLERQPAGGYGVCLITRLVDEVLQRTTASGQNELLLIKLQ